MGIGRFDVRGQSRLTHASDDALGRDPDRRDDDHARRNHSKKGQVADKVGAKVAKGPSEQQSLHRDHLQFDLRRGQLVRVAHTRHNAAVLYAHHLIAHGRDALVVGHDEHRRTKAPVDLLEQTQYLE